MEGGIFVACINLKSRPDRWKRFSEQPEMDRIRKEFAFERIEGVLGSKVEISKDERISLRTKRNILEATRRGHEELNSAGGVGCYLSHVNTWKKFLDRPEPYLIVFEDDAKIPSGFVDKLYSAMRDVSLLSQVPDVWYFRPTDYVTFFKADGKMKPKQIGPWDINTCSTFTGYLLSKAGAKKLVEGAFPIDMHVDHYTCLNNRLGNTFSVFHRDLVVTIATLKEGDSDIHLSGECTICDIPTNVSGRDYIILNIPGLILGVGIGLALYWLKTGGRRRKLF
jgi:GR25 family glycosyltransferase involved in LPS biosynthesis